MLFLAVSLLGIISFFRLPVDLLPDVSYPRLVIYTSYPNVAPAEVERLITELMEAQGAAVPGVEQVTSVSREGVSLVTLRFAWGTDMDFAMLNVRERLDNVRELLPETSGRPRILRIDPEAEPIVVLSVAGGADLWATKNFVETVFRRRLEQLDGVARAAVTGGLDREIRVEIDPDLLLSYGLEMEEVAAALDRANVSAPGGSILRGRYRYPLRILGEFRTVDQVGEVVVGRQQTESGGQREREGSFRLVRVDDVAQVVDGFADRQSIARYNGAEAVGLLVYKESGANTVAVANRIDAALTILALEFPDITVDVAYSQAGFISDSISSVVQALVFGGFLAFLVLFLFLRNLRYPLAIAVAIPISVAGAFALMEAFGLSLNIMSLGGMALGVGMLVDNSIIVLENIFRHREGGVPLLEASALGGEEVQGAITASTLTTISVFGPIVYIEGVAGEMFGDLSLAVAFSLLASLLVALTLLPGMAAHYVDRMRPPPRSGRLRPHRRRGMSVRIGRAFRWVVLLPFRLIAMAGALAQALLVFWWEGLARLIRRIFGPPPTAVDPRFQGLTNRYHQLLKFSLDHRRGVLAASGAALAATLTLALTLDRDLLPDVDQGGFRVRIELPEGTSLAATVLAVEEIEQALRDDPGVHTIFSHLGDDVLTYTPSEAASGAHTGNLEVRVHPGIATNEVMERVRAVEALFPPGTLAFEAGRATALGGVLDGADADISVRIRGENLEESHAYAEMVREELSTLAEIGNVRVGAGRGQPQVQVEILRDQAARHNIDPRLVADETERAMRGDRATGFVDFDRKIDVVVRLPDALRFSVATLETLPVNGVPLRELVTVREAVGTAEIHRDDQQRVVTVYADVISGGLNDAIRAIETELSELAPPLNMRVDVGGENQEMRRSFHDLGFAFALALALVYMILAAQFESFKHPLVILISVPLALSGAVPALALAGQSLNTMSLIGIVILVGVVVNDAILKVEFIRQARARGAALREAILEAGRVRLRPTVMTTVTTVCGLTPMALGIGRGADLRAPLAIAVIGGVVMATALTLIVVPVVYSLVEDGHDRLRSKTHAPRAGRTAEVLR